MLAPTVQKLRLAIAFVALFTVIAVITAATAIRAAVTIGLVVIPRTAALPLIPRFRI